MDKQFYVYIMSNIKNTVLYTGVTNNIVARVLQHKAKQIEGFTKKYNCIKLLWFEQTDDVASAIQGEKRIKKWKRVYKENLIKEKNPNWEDLAKDWDE